jgi:hypothetical protein
MISFEKLIKTFMLTGVWQSEVHEMIPDVSRSLVHEMMKEVRLPKMLPENHKKNWMGAAPTFLMLWSEEAAEFCDSMVTGDESEWFTTHLKANYSDGVVP